MTKHCKHCNLDLPVEDFYKDSKTKDGRTVYCKAYYASYYKQNSTRQKRTSHRARVRRRYGITLDVYDQLLAAGCQVCGSKERLCIDHCHKTGVTRGCLCQDCNQALGNAKDDPAILRKLAEYLEAGANLGQGVIGPAY